MKHFLIFLLIAAGQLMSAQSLPGNPELSDDDTYGYLYCHKSAHGGWTAYAMSQDGIHFHDLLCGDSIFPDEAGGVVNGSAPYVCRAKDGGFLMVARCGFSRIDIFRSDDLVGWNRVITLIVPGNSRIGDAKIIWDDKYGPDGGYLVYFPMTNSSRVGHMSLYGMRVEVNLSGGSRPELLADWGFDIEDAVICSGPKGGYCALIKGRDGGPGLLVSRAEAPDGPWSDPAGVAPEGNRAVGGPAVFRLVGTQGWQVGYVFPDGGPVGGYRICTADDSFTEMRRPQYLEGVYGPEEGSFLRISEAEYNRLQAWSDEAEAEHLAPSVHNPVFPGLHADPEVLYSEQTGRYYIYPTTDGAFGWHNHDFKCFSSADLVHWKDEGVILDLQDLEWGKEYAWAPCIIEKKVGKEYRYYYYFVANKSVGVAVADRPEGPYRDALGRPLLSQDEIGAPNQVIDPDVFRDPATGKYYLYWGNSYLWMAELADDMISLVPGTMHELIPRSRIGEYHYLEGTYVFERNGLYYFMWSENITRSARYCIRYLISDSPTEFVRNGKPAKVEEQIILQQDPSLQIFGTGHNSVLNIPGTDDWYMVYHRFTRPEGIKMGLSGGYNREVCIDRMYFNPDGTIIPVKPTL
ncbi:MAG: family 43 glycosylhydrolase [Bacteroidales bacterium]|nr:family 43 glycosylhydrolase [Bacteroidales bacterium]